MSSMTTMEMEIATLMVQALNLEVAAQEIVPEDALFYEGLGLDSIDALELAMEISVTYGFEMRAEDEENEQIFASLRALAGYIESNRTK